MSNEDADRTPSSEETEDRRSDFPRYRPVMDPPGQFAEFVETMRTLQDLAVSVDAPDDVISSALEQAKSLVDVLRPYEAREGLSPAGRLPVLPGFGSLLLPPFVTEHFGPDGVRLRGEFRRYHLGGNAAAHGGVLPLLFDLVYGMVIFAAKRPISRTAYLHVNYRKVTPLHTPLVIEGSIDRTEGRKTFVTARLTTPDGTLLADGDGLMVQLLPGQP